METNNIGAGAQIRNTELQVEDQTQTPGTGMVQMKISGSRQGKCFVMEGSTQMQ